jgi:uncharacterized protein (DUF362 family)
MMKTSDRTAGIKRLINKIISPADFRGKRIALKANYNSDDDFPASTHLDVGRAQRNGSHERCLGGSWRL